uniref:Death domain-containing protein n=2 Tax=Amphimedon queenslandica TaxID=400682 RepID=A0A1X7TKC1_AMPQE
MNTSFEPLRIINTYGAFGSVTKERTEVITEETYDFIFGRNGEGAHGRKLSSTNYQHNPWLHFCAKLLAGDPSLNSLIAHNPFKEKPPNFVRALHYQYKYTKIGRDIELNPGPTIDDQPDISLLIQWLEPLVDWKSFGLCLVGMKEHDILKIEQDYQKIEDRKLALYSIWLSVNPKATWRDVIDALTRIEKNKLVHDIKDHIYSDFLTIQSDGYTEIIFFPKDDQTVQNSLDKLQANFSHIMMKIKLTLCKKVTNDDELSTKISYWVEHQLNLKHGTVNNDLDDIFTKIHVYLNYDFIDCSLIVAMCNEFISDEKDLLYKLKTYSLEANAFRSSEPIKDLKQKLRKVYGPYRRCLENMPLICIELQNPWNDVKINGLYILIGRLLPKELRQSIMKCITIEPGSVVIKLHIYDVTAASLIEYTGGKLQFMHIIGIFSLYINDHPVLQEDENMSFTFELALLEAVTAGNNTAVEFLLQLKTVNIDHTNEEGETALMLACERGQDDIVHSLLSAGANVDIHDNKGWTALMRASVLNHISIIFMLLQANANLHLKESQGLNAVMIASYYGHYEVVKLLISKGVEYQQDEVNAFMLVCHNGHTQIVKLLLKEQVDPNVQDKDGWNAFMVACQNGHTQIVELLLKEKVNPNVQKKDGWNAFMVACQNGHTQIVKMLLKEQVDPNIQDKDGWNAFMLACRNGHIQIVELLLKEQVDPNVQNKDGWNAFMVACQNGHISIIEWLLKKQVNPNVQKNNGWNAFMSACRNGHTEVVKILLKEQANPNVQKKDGWNAFMLACQNGHTEIVELLLKEQVDPNVQDIDGWNAFMLACQNGHSQIIEMLLKEHVDPNVQKNNGWNAFLSASKNGHTQIAKLLLKEKVNPNYQDKDGWNAFMLACQNGHTKLVELLLKEQVDPNVQTKDGENALMLACQSGHSEVVALLLKAQVNPNIQDKKGHTALIIASAKGHYEVVKLLIELKADPTIKSNKGHTALKCAENIEISLLLSSYLKEYYTEQQDDAASVFSLTSGYYTAASDNTSIRSAPSNLSLDLLIDYSSDAESDA